MDDRPPSTISIALALLGFAAAAAVGLWLIFWVARLVAGPPPPTARQHSQATVPRAQSGPSVSDSETTAALPAVAATAPPVVPSPAPATPVIIPFSATAARRHMRYLAGNIGPRSEGTARELAAATYISRKLRRYGYRVRLQEFSLPNGATSRNVIASKSGRSSARLLLGAHFDTKADTPGANDNASGAAVVLELARVLRTARTQPGIMFVFFGAEEMIDSNRDHHHYGSRTFVDRLSRSDRKRLAGAISVDMVGYGSNFYVRTMGKGPQQLKQRLLWLARKKGVAVSYEQDGSQYGYSDHEPFELAGIPAAWLQWREDPMYHTAGDDTSHVRFRPLRVTGDYVQRLVMSLSAPALKTLQAANEN